MLASDSELPSQRRAQEQSVGDVRHGHERDHESRAPAQRWVEAAHLKVRHRCGRTLCLSAAGLRFSTPRPPKHR